MSLMDPRDERPPFVTPAARSFAFGPLGIGVAQLVGGAGLWMGFGIEETTGLAAARCVIGDGNGGAISNMFAPITFVASESRIDPLPGRGVAFYGGLVVQVTAGSVGGALWAALLTRDELDAVLSARAGFEWRR